MDRQSERQSKLLFSRHVLKPIMSNCKIALLYRERKEDCIFWYSAKHDYRLISVG
jgi:hypothetical protein